MADSWDVIVVGAGIGGLSAAIALAGRGCRVLVLEAAPRPGGKAGVTIVDGVEVDTGPSVLTMPDVFRSLLATVGASLDDEVDLLVPDPGFRYVYPDGVVLDVWHRLEDTLASVETTLGPASAQELRSFLDYACRIWEAAAPNFVYGDAPSWRSVLGGGLRSITQLTRVDPFSAMWSAIEKRVRSPHLQMLLARYATYNGSDVRRAPATLNCISHVELALGGFGVRGGMYELVRALVRVAERAGVTIRCGAPVKEIVASKAGARGVVLANGRRIDSSFVVANADASAVTKHLLPRGLSHGIREDITPSMSGFTAVVKAERMPRVAHTVLFPERYLDEFADIFDGDRPPSEPTVYLCAQETCHRRPSWPEHEPVFVMANAPAEPEEGTREPAVWQALDRRVMQRSVGAGLLRACDRVLWRRTPRELAVQFPGSRGAIYGSASNDSTAAFQRPPNRVPGVRGLYLASGSAHPGGGVPLAALSGMAAARALEADFQIRRAG